MKSLNKVIFTGVLTVMALGISDVYSPKIERAGSTTQHANCVKSGDYKSPICQAYVTNQFRHVCIKELKIVAFTATSSQKMQQCALAKVAAWNNNPKRVIAEPGKF